MASSSSSSRRARIAHLLLQLVAVHFFYEFLEGLLGHHQFPLKGFAHLPLGIPKLFVTGCAEQTTCLLDDILSFERRVFLKRVPRLSHVQCDVEVPMPIPTPTIVVAVSSFLLVSNKVFQSDDQVHFVILALPHNVVDSFPHLFTKWAHCACPWADVLVEPVN